MKSALIIEDEKLSADRLNDLVQEHTSLQVTSVCYSVKSAVKWLGQHGVPDIIFMDIQLGDGTGFDILDHIESYPFIIFTTAFDKYTLKAFKYNSIDYLLKPIKVEDLTKAVAKFQRVNESSEVDTKIEALKKEILKDFRTKFLIKTGLKYRSVTTADISYFYSSEGTTYIKTREDESLILDVSLDQLEHTLDPSMYFRVNRHLIVSSNHIASIDSYFNGRLSLVLKPNFSEQVIVSREKVRSFKEWLDN